MENNWGTKSMDSTSRGGCKWSFEKVKELGKGGQGCVWLVREKTTGLPYAAKFVNFVQCQG